jgi:hypothetical protein
MDKKSAACTLDNNGNGENQQYLQGYKIQSHNFDQSQKPVF